MQKRYYKYKELSIFFKKILEKFYKKYGYNDNFNLLKKFTSEEEDLKEYKKYLEISEKEYKYYNSKKQNNIKIHDLENWLDHFNYCYSEKY